jgi:hypothetical protein
MIILIGKENPWTLEFYLWVLGQAEGTKFLPAVSGICAFTDVIATLLYGIWSCVEHK